MVICPDCGKNVHKGKFCKNCGSALPEIEEISTPTTKSDTCLNCGEKINSKFKFCPNCGFNLKQSTSNTNLEINQSKSIVKNQNEKIDNVKAKNLELDNNQQFKEKNIWVAIILSVLLPGLGQIYLRLDNKGSIFLISYVISCILILLVIGIILCIILWIWALIDTIISTNAINRGEKVEDKLF